MVGIEKRPRLDLSVGLANRARQASTNCSEPMPSRIKRAASDADNKCRFVRYIRYVRFKSF